MAADGALVISRPCSRVIVKIFTSDELKWIQTEGDAVTDGCSVSGISPV